MRNLWEQLFSKFLKKYHLTRYFSKSASFDELQQSSYAQQVSEQFTKNLKHASEISVEDIIREKDAHIDGLDEKEAELRQKQHGLNELQSEKPLAWWQHLWYCYKNPFNILLTILAIICAFTDDMKGTIVISSMVIISTILRFWQEAKSNKAADTLKSMVSNDASVLRRNTHSKFTKAEAINASQQSKDLFDIPTKYLVPGDIIKLSAGDLIPADCRLIETKDLFVSQAAMTGESMPVEKFATHQSENNNNTMALDNIAFMGTSVISGTATAIVITTGKQTYFGALAKRVTENDQVTTSFQKGVNSVSWLLIRFTLIMSPIVLLLNGYTTGNWTDACLFALAVAVGLTPEMLPMIVTSTLAKGAVFLSRKKVIVKRLDAIQNFGAMDVLCTDKTGTLTQDKIILSKHTDVMGKVSEPVLLLGYINSYHQTGLKNLLDLAILEHANSDIKMEKLSYNKLDEIPFDFNRRRMSVVVKTPRKQARIITKGAVEEMLNICSHVEINHEIVPLTSELAKTILTNSQNHNKDGLRVIAIGYRDSDIEQDKTYGVKDEQNLILSGFLTFLDPPKDSSVKAIQALHEHGVTVKVLTGDNEFVTQKVCHEIGLPSEHIVLGEDIDRMSTTEFKEAVEKYQIFAKLNPMHKERIVTQLKENDHVVGFLGDGINDAAALRTADIGISVDTAVDIAKESADLILLEKSLMVLEQGVIEGRRTFANILKYIKITASSNFGNVFSVLIASAFIPFLPMLPIHLLIQNLLYDVSQIAVPFDNVDEESLKEPQRWDASGIGRFMIFFGPISSIFDITTFLLMWFIFQANTPEHQTLFQSGWFIEGLLTQTLIVHMIRTKKIPFIQSCAALPLLVMTAVIIMIGIFLPMGPLASYFSLQSLPLTYFIYLPIILLAYMILTQLLKKIYVKRYGWQ
ncbi:magnesium-translocating P-type ATPase [Acinetobacter rathckeae]|uniref:magnesium-translocating P-type ATPase n=1 Tax=Acinetobacter rathckeae TaxID=2605272 RepID=UPI0018A2DDAF|nr:magnesium-translocating P-type ATPase [Acinetobacter rathckeae]MBF7694861.1 magnesium-translocating P-type ATPase [Acinetobacter rathckeae]